MLTSLVQPAAYTFIYRFMANKSEEHPQGKLNGEVLKAFFAVEGEDGHFTYNEGHERIPDNWYKRNVLDEYTIPYFSLDNLEMASQHPEFLSVGGNTGMFFQMADVYNTNVSQGTVDSFVGVDPADLTGGVFNGATLLEGYVVDSLTQWVESLLTKTQQQPRLLRHAGRRSAAPRRPLGRSHRRWLAHFAAYVESRMPQVEQH
jgi:hypothetical protein